MTATPTIVIYATRSCPFCIQAKSLLREKGVAFEEIDVGAEPQRRAEMMQRARGRRTVPQIFVGDVHVGGCDDLYALDRSGRLDPLLAGSAG
ncbi:glutaredoxin 3 [Paracoccus spongiarum]|uniref:Glutaredoxin n=1 Tax=Paracoccus spongiarum TaxID=3064387 RepID=A0ABT9JH13_9RHOB|nr:glutaredoxin 3 [Paracoccus sp. 2205BS29-5]MDP5308341.1 glutaredoxin 3 [Paracoccus sp. 2205BS29-5]